jgi:hypothetical protein
MAYDATTIRVRDGKVGSKDGQGVKDQRNPDMAYTPSADAIELARTTPPDTRAADRVQQILGTVGVTKVTWDKLLCENGHKKSFRPTYNY